MVLHGRFLMESKIQKPTHPCTLWTQKISYLLPPLCTVHCGVLEEWGSASVIETQITQAPIILHGGHLGIVIVRI